jgi:hypothetical protein
MTDQLRFLDVEKRIEYDRWMKMKLIDVQHFVVEKKKKKQKLKKNSSIISIDFN